MRRRFHDDEQMEGDGEDELNLTPYLDLITTLVIFFIFTFQIVIEFRLIDVMPPEISSKPAEGQSAGNQVRLNLFVTQNGYLIDASGTQSDGAPIAVRAVIEKKNGGYDTKLLTEKMVELKKTYGLGESLVLVAHEAVEYRDVVAAMDAVRGGPKTWLFPDVVFGQPVGG